MKKLHARELSRNQSILHFDVILQHDWPIEQCVLHVRVFFGGKTRKPCFDLFIHWQIKQMTNTCRNHFSRTYENRSHGTELEQVAPTHLICTGAVGRECLVNYSSPHSWILRSKSYPVLLSFSRDICMRKKYLLSVLNTLNETKISIYTHKRNDEHPHLSHTQTLPVIRVKNWKSLLFVVIFNHFSAKNCHRRSSHCKE